MLRFLKVTGESLSPGYQEGDFVLIAKIPFFFTSLHPGDVVVFRHEQYGLMIKRVAEVDGLTRQVFVVGDHPWSVDSRQFGSIDRDHLLGKVIWHIARPNR